jgi:hypothetical protein
VNPLSRARITTIESGSGIMNGVTVFCWLALSVIPGTDGPNRFGATRYRIIE